jgi:hypothetical protein
MKKILPTITTTGKSNWRNKIKEVKKFQLKEVALFPTCLEKKQREELYSLLQKFNIRNIPFVHIRSDMDLNELDFLIKEFKVKIFNIHSDSEFPFVYDYSRYKKMIFVENVYYPLNEKEVRKFAGICLDLTHLENDKIFNPEKYQHNLKIIEKYPIGCNHVSSFQKNIRKDKRGYIRQDNHFLKNLTGMDYLKKYPKKYFSPFIAIELENSIKTQLKVKDYIKWLK